jgi:heme-degrading monooxygenase HmoA
MGRDDTEEEPWRIGRNATYHRSMEQNSDKDGVTFINIFEIAREDVPAFTDGWRRLAAIMAAAPGFRGAQLHEAVSGEARFQLVNIARWDSEQAWRDAAANPEMREAATRFGSDPAAPRPAQYPGLYRPTLSFTPEG